MPTEQYHLYRWKMDTAPPVAQCLTALAQRRPGFMEEVFVWVRDGGPVVVGHLSVRDRPKGTWWDWTTLDGARVPLLTPGRLTAVEAPERLRSRRLHPGADDPSARCPVRQVPTEREARKELLLRATWYLGVGTFTDLTDYHRQKNPPCKPLVAELVEEGQLVPVQGGGLEGISADRPPARQRPWTVRACALPTGGSIRRVAA